ncbi:N-acetylglucosamine-6-phosphate deacetylase [Mesorhizobium sp. L-8-10]|uniref:N-acetylglucosamine-6-phosphate deacetylase n=1 Tax=Mesorhizobium sp. L-8-10 TaxID=2744523 RepID=UPI0019259B90|nr:amidohydrolase family protein [Mesorhizobium sp. L-8-10]BCH33051.1 N-acetylglucosamine-6-phosphate deacetylase [Mesorhizobium sp. L-8-10]
MDKKLLIRGKVILPEGIVDDAVVRCENGRIVAVELFAPRHVSEDLVDCSGSYVSPGFVDIHVHGAAGADYMDGTAEAVRMANRAHARHGTTSLFPTTTTGSFGQLDAMVRSCEEVRRQWSVSDGARIAGIHFYGPYFAEDKVGVHAREGRRDPVREEYEYFLRKEIIRIATCASELPGALDFFDHAREQGCFITCGHSNARWSELEAAFAHGMRHVDHFWCAMSSVSSLRGRFGFPMQAGMEQYVLANKGMSTEVIADGVHLSDDLLRFAYEVIGFERTCLVTDSNRAMDAPPGKYRFGPSEDGTWVFSDGNAVRGADGSLASSMRGMDWMVRTMAGALGRDLHNVVRMASLTPATLAGIADEVGSIAPGKLADIVVLGPELDVRRVYIGAEAAYAA